MQPMLAFKYQDHKSKVRYPCYVQPKLDGVRMLATRHTLQTRSYGREEEKVFAESRLVHIRECLGHLEPSLILDGELYIHGEALQRINSRVSINSHEPRPNEQDLQYHIFDLINARSQGWTFGQRFQMVQYICAGHRHLKPVPTFFVQSEAEADSLYREFKSQGYEGMMYRSADSPYGLSRVCTNQENRWHCLLKRKDWLDAEFEIVDFRTTIGEKGETGFNLDCKTEDGSVFSVGTGLSDIEIQDFANDPPIGKLAKLRFDSRSLDNIPLKAHVVEIL